MRFLVTGGAGFIGSHLCRKLLDEGHKVISIDKSQKIITGLYEHEHFNHYMLNILMDMNGFDNILKKVDVIYHLASPVGVKMISENPSLIFDIIDGSDIISQIGKDYGIKVIFASTSEVYGNIPDGKAIETANLVMGPPTQLRYGYACAKLMSEFFFKIRECNHIIVRLFNIVGTRQTGQYGHVLPRFIEAGMKGKDIIVYGDGTQVRAFCDVRDCVDALYKLGITNEHDNEIFNIGTDTPIDIDDLGGLVQQMTGGKSVMLYRPFKSVYDHPDIQRRVPNIDKIRKAINFEPQYNIEDTIRSML